MKQVLVIVGPTASGKTALSLALAAHYQTEIINGDSVQVYAKYNVGSAKITQEEMQGIKHHLLSIVSPQHDYDVSQFQHDARQVIQTLDFPIICGGTGLYIKSTLYDYDFSVPKRVIETSDLPNDTLYDNIKAFDKDYQGDPNNRRRLIRAYDLVKQGYKPSEQAGKNVPLYDILTIYLNVERAVLKKRLIQRLDQQLEQGFIEEVQDIQSLAPIKNVIGYREIDAYLNHGLTYENMKTTIISKSMTFAKRQKTWFLNQMNPHVFDAQSDTLVQEVIKVVDAWKK